MIERAVIINTLDSDNPIPVLFNPEEYSINRENNYAQTAIPGLSAPLTQFVNGNAQTLEMELESPANDIVGFEHAPENESQKAKIENALAVLKSKAGIFKTTSAANCQIKDVSGEFEVQKDHAGFHITWKIKCLNPEKLKYLETTFFQNFSKAQEIEVEIISASGQKAIEWGNKTKQIKIPNLSK